ncbi:hypothetical protein C2G38_2224941 [Gigaspora rosea]|uniref:Uncharacterized protein n=1 Tax=Gigaspora rosea TaxID=44941 RepID=A0A397U3X7_9GLOM|nr:hypothetical protein C2G38_2224941 [Gigaspora rosea]
MYEIHVIEKDETLDIEKDEIATLKKIVVGGLRLSLVDLDCCWWVKVYVAFGGLWWVEVVFGEFRLLLVGLRCFWWVEVVFGEFRLLLVGLRCFWWVLVGLRRSTGPGEGIGYVLSLRVKTYELAVLEVMSQSLLDQIDSSGTTYSWWGNSGEIGWGKPSQPMRYTSTWWLGQTLFYELLIMYEKTKL